MIKHVQIEVTMLQLKLRQSVSSGVTTGQRKFVFKARQTLIFGFLYIQFNFFLIIKFYFWTFLTAVILLDLFKASKKGFAFVPMCLCLITEGVFSIQNARLTPEKYISAVLAAAPIKQVE